MYHCSSIKSVMLSIATCSFLLPCVCAAQYIEPGKIGDIKSWETNEYKAYWGLGSMNASVAYAKGATGKGIKLGVVDSGMLLSHQEFVGNRVKGVVATGQYSKDGMRYPDAAYGNAPFIGKGSEQKDRNNKGEFKKGDKFKTSGDWIAGVNDSHGTHVGGTIGANRDGSGMHGVAWEANLYSGNTGGTDGMTYGPNQDYGYFYAVYNELAKSGVRAVNNSWGSNRKVNSSYSGAEGYYSAGTPTNPTRPGDFLYIKDLNTAKKAYYQFVVDGQKNFIDAAYEVAKKHKMIQVFTAGNRDGMEESYTRAMLPYFRPDIESLWLNVTGQTQGNSQRFNTAGHSKWWTIAAPGEKIKSSIVDVKTGEAGYDSWDGTSMAAPHVTGALGVIMSRYSYMTNEQIRDVLLTTARQTKYSFKKNDKSKISGWSSDLGVPDKRWGWGIVDIGKAMFGPGQFLGKFDISMDVDDVWSNDISDKAIKFRKTEDEEDALTWASRKTELDNRNVTLTPDEKAEYEIELARQKAREHRKADGYNGTLIKRGNGTLTLTGNNTYSGDTIIKQGQITALNQSLKNSNVVVENGGALKIKNILVIQEVKTDFLNRPKELIDKDRVATPDTVKATIKDGGKYILSHSDKVGDFSVGAKNLDINFEKNSIIDLETPLFEDAQNAYKDPTKTNTYFVEGNFKGYNQAILKIKYAFFDLQKDFSNTKLKLNLKKANKGMVDFAKGKNQKLVAGVIEKSNNNPNSNLYKQFLLSTPQEASDTLKTFANEANFASQNAAIVDSILIRNSIISRRSDFNTVMVDDNDTGINFWSNTSGNKIKSNSDDGIVNFKSTSINQLFGLDGAIGENSVLGFMLGAGKTKTAEDGNNEFNHTNKYVGVYSQIDLNPIRLNLGTIYTDIKRKKTSSSTVVQHVVNNDVKSNEKLINFFANVTYEGLNGENFKINPYFGISHIYAKVDETTENVGPFMINVDNKTRNINILTAGISPSLPFKFGNMDSSAQFDFAYNRFFGDINPNATVGIADAGYVNLKGNDIKNFATLGAGIETKIFNNTSLKLSYNGAFGSNIKSNSLNAKIEISF
ncbi:S8 family serine peptidase [Campylobacter ureolyticus]|uniref:S8 family serine peptidase n=1 Tax=Campylobacter ureolyticus TaxID=827 RepID=UPI0026EE517B|nr:S8 family serine peptidase [Campylobacter ureolyticus]